MIGNLLKSLGEIKPRIEQAGSFFVGLDFDGTLAPICSHPDRVELSEPVRETVRLLEELPNVTVMIVSGRARADVASRVGLPDLIYAGNHGLEIRGPGLEFEEPVASALADRLVVLAAGLQDALREVPSALVEPKGLTLSVHDRNVAPEFQPRVEEAVRIAAGIDPESFLITQGHRVWEIRPRVTWHKGKAILWVLDRVGGSPPRLEFYLGDDRTDEDAFASLPNGVTVKVGNDLSTRARYSLAGPGEVESFLGWLLGSVRQAGG